MKHTEKRRAKADPAVAATPTEQSGREPLVRDEDIEILAYSYWQARAGSAGSADDDWLRAERELRQRASQKSLAAESGG